MHPMKPATDVEVLQIVDDLIFAEHKKDMTQESLAEARKTAPYQHMQRVGVAAFRLAEVRLLSKKKQGHHLKVVHLKNVKR